MNMFHQGYRIYPKKNTLYLNEMQEGALIGVNGGDKAYTIPWKNFHGRNPRLRIVDPVPGIPRDYES